MRARTCANCGRPCSRGATRCRACSNVENGRQRRGRPVPKLQAPRRGVPVEGPGGDRWRSMTEAAGRLDRTRTALYPHAAWEGGRWRLVSLPARLRDGVVVTPPPLEHLCAPLDNERELRGNAIRDEGEGRAMDVLTVEEVALMFRVSPESVREWIRAGELEAYQLPNRAYRIEAEAVEDLKNRRRRPARSQEG